MRGQSTLEALLAMAFAGAALFSGIMTMYISFAHGWMSYAVHKGVLCIAEKQAAHICQESMRTKAQQFLAFGEITKAVLETRASSYFGEMTLEILPKGQAWKITESYELTQGQINKASYY